MNTHKQEPNHNQNIPKFWSQSRLSQPREKRDGLGAMTALADRDGGVVVRGGRERERGRGLGWVCHRFNGAAGARGCREKERNYKREKEKSEWVKKKG